MNFLKQLENAPKHLVLYALGMIGSMVDDYTLITLTIFCVLLGFVLGSVLIPITTFFGLYFVMRLVAHITDVIGYHANVTAGTPPLRQVAGTVVEGDTLP